MGGTCREPGLEVSLGSVVTRMGVVEAAPQGSLPGCLPALSPGVRACLGRGSGSRGALPGPLPSAQSVEPETLGGGCRSQGAYACQPFRAVWTGLEGRGRGPRRPDSPPPLWLVWMHRSSPAWVLATSQSPERRPGGAGACSLTPHGLGSLAASSVFPRGETWFLLAQGLLGRK